MISIKGIAFSVLNLFVLFSSGQVQRDTNVVIVDIGKHSRNELADIIRKVNAVQPKVIGLDILFWEDSLMLDTALVNALNATPNIVFGTRLYGHVQDNFFLENRKSIKKFCADNRAYGFTNLVAYDSIVMELQPRAFANFEMHYAFAVKIANMYNPAKTQLFIDRFNKIEKIKFKGGSEKYTVIKQEQLTSSLELLKNKIVLLGYAEGNDEDIFKIPSLNHSVTKMHGVLIHANIISMILEKSYLN